MGERRDRLVARLTALPAMQPLERVCQGGIDVVGRATCAVVLMSGDEVGALTASCGPAVAVASDLQFELGEGPCLTSFREGTSVFASDLAGSSRWPVFAAAAVVEGVRSVAALPMQVGGIRLGVFYLGDGHPGDVEGEALSDAYELAHLATLVVLDQQHDRGVLAGTPDTDEWTHRAVVHQATGMVSAQLDVPLHDALARLRATAYSTGRPLNEIAADVVDRRLRLANDSGDST